MSKYFLERGDCSRHAIFPGVEIFTAAGEHAMISLVEMEAGAVVERHSHRHEQMGMLIEGELHFTIGDEQRTVQPGGMWRIPGGVEHTARAGDRPVKALDVFYPIREDYR